MRTIRIGSTFWIVVAIELLILAAGIALEARLVTGFAIGQLFVTVLLLVGGFDFDNDNSH